MNTGFKYDEGANSKDLTDEEVASALATSCVEDIAKHLKEAACPQCKEAPASRKDERRFRYPHAYWRSVLKCANGHTFQRVFQVTWLHKPG